MATEPAGRAGKRRPPILALESASERLVCMYLDRVPAALADEIARDLRLPRETIATVLESLTERGFVRRRGLLYVLSVERAD
ncbi:helix-turn-helix domain-containing protein [Natronomonas amylolytica]|uniref:helix-turn-helix domain-containing protein n=1 Tax=Natronomonas amylolytica TaxID=3108498 RepID=UPI00300B79CF